MKVEIAPPGPRVAPDPAENLTGAYAGVGAAATQHAIPPVAPRPSSRGAGAGFTDLKSAVVDACGAAPCGPELLNATKSDTRAFWVAGGGIEWAFTGNWTVKSEYLFLGLNDSFGVCGAGGGAAVGSTFCSN